MEDGFAYNTKRDAKKDTFLCVLFVQSYKLVLVVTRKREGKKADRNGEERKRHKIYSIEASRRNRSTKNLRKENQNSKPNFVGVCILQF